MAAKDVMTLAQEAGAKGDWFRSTADAPRSDASPLWATQTLDAARRAVHIRCDGAEHAALIGALDVFASAAPAIREMGIVAFRKTLVDLSEGRPAPFEEVRTWISSRALAAVLPILLAAITPEKVGK